MIGKICRWQAVKRAVCVESGALLLIHVLLQVGHQKEGNFLCDKPHFVLHPQPDVTQNPTLNIFLLFKL